MLYTDISMCNKLGLYLFSFRIKSHITLRTIEFSKWKTVLSKTLMQHYLTYCIRRLSLCPKICD